MPDLVSLLRDGATNLWLFIPTAVLLGALHGLEPGHSKTMMAAFIIAVRGTVGQAILLGLAATISHTLIVWLVALLGLHFGSAYATEAVEPWLQLISGVIIIAIALWMMRQTFAEQHHHHDHEHHDHDHDHDHAHVHHHDHSKTQQAGLQLGSLDYEDAHARAHRLEIEKRFAGRKVTTGQIVMFGLTGGLIPCPASVTVLLVCLQLKQIAIGALLVLCFSFGLAVTMVAVGAVAALGMDRAQRSWDGFGKLAARAPYISSALVILIGLYSLYLGFRGLGA
ncbi:MAG: nickel/cobalt efflux transporter RcnA [Hyphomicrobiales bacterium]|nr:nickel/cobalt efflux transporter RcnA [Hyphomicrobiales bacterium]